MKLSHVFPRNCPRLLQAGFLVVVSLFLFTRPGYGQEPITMNTVRAQEEFRWGVLAFHKGLYNESILSFEKALTYRPDIMLPRLWLGRAYYMSGFEDAALNEWQTVLRSNQGSPSLQNLADIVTFRRGTGKELDTIERYVSAFELEGGAGRNPLFQRPAGIQPRSDGSFMLTSFASNEVLVMAPGGSVRQRFRDGLEGFDHPFDVAASDEGFFFVSEFSANRIAKCSPQGNKLLTFGKKGRAAGELLGPQYLSLEEEGYLYVSEWGNRRVSKFDLNGTFILSFGAGSGSFPGLLGPTGVTVMSGRVFVADRLRRTIDVFDMSGNYLSSLAAGKLHAPEGLRVFHEGVLLVADSDRVVAVDVERDSIAVLSEMENAGRRITQAVVDANGNLLVSDFDAGRVSILSELSAMYSGLFVRIDRVNADRFPDVTCEITVETRLGNPVVGLTDGNFILTEDRAPVTGKSLVFSGYRTENTSLSLLVERSRQMIPFRQAIRDVSLRTGRDLRAGDALKVVTAGELPVVEYTGLSPADIAQAAAEKGSYSGNWKFDIGLRLAASELIPDARKKAVVYLTGGLLDENTFDRYGLVELAQYLKNNGIAFIVVDTDGGELAPELDYLVRETGGRLYSLLDPEGTARLVERLRGSASGKYLLTYRSTRNPDFGRAYLPVEVEAALLRKSGRDEAGYFTSLE